MIDEKEINDSFSKLFFEFENNVQPFKEGCFVDGVVVYIGKVVGVDIGFKSIGYIPVDEFKDDDIKIGDTVTVLLNKIENKKGELLLSRRQAKRYQLWEHFKQCFENKTKVEGEILGKIKGGFVVNLSGLMAFLPKSQIDVSDLLNIDGLIKNKFEFLILKINDSKGNIIVSKKAIFDEERNKERDKILSTINVGDVFEGVVKNITDYGAFIDFGSFDGLLHLTDISWYRVKHPSDLLKVGESVKVQVIKYDPEIKKVSLGMKQLQENPWKTITDQYPIGSITKGKIVSITQYGLFVEIPNKLEGLVHMSEISWYKNNTSPMKAYNIGQEIDVMILDIDCDHRRISLGIKQTTPNPWKIFAEEHNIGDILDVVVKNTTNFAVFVELLPGINGCVHVSDLNKKEDLKTYNAGDKIQVVLLSTNYEKERISLGVKQLAFDLKNEVKRFVRGSNVTFIVRMVKKDFLEVEVECGLKAIIKKIDISKDKKEQKTDKFQVGEKLSGKVLLFNPKNGQFFITLKAIADIDDNDIDENSFDIDQYSDVSTGNTLGSIFGKLFNQMKK